MDDASLTQSGMIAGTPGYMSPEQANGELVDYRSDLFSLGSVLYFLCTGRPPFVSGSTMVTLKRVCSQEPQSIREVAAEVPEWLTAIIAKLHAKSPDDRCKNATEVLELLRLQAAGLPQTDRHDASQDTPNRHFREVRRSGGRRLRWMTACVLLIGLAGIGRNFWSFSDVQPGSTSVIEAGTTATSLTSPDLTSTKLLVEVSPLDGRSGANVASASLVRLGNGRADDAPQELIGVLEETSYLLPWFGQAHWMCQSPDSRLLAVPSSNTVVLFEATTGEMKRVLTGPVNRVFHTAYSPDGKLVAAGGGNSGTKDLECRNGRIGDNAGAERFDNTQRGVQPGRNKTG